MPFDLDAFLGDLDRETFMRDVWPRGFHATPDRPGRFDELIMLESLASPAGLVDEHVGEIFVLGPKSLRATTTPADAAEFYRVGCTLYFIDAHRSLPELTPFREALAASVGCALEDVSCEAFAAREGAHSSLHFDHEYNFHVVISGRKRWRLRENDAVCAPLSGYVSGSSQSDIADVHLYRDGALLDVIGAEATEVELGPGDAVFFSRGVWHEIDCLEDSVSVNFAVHPPAWWELLLDALRPRLQRDPALREFVFGVDTPEGPPASAVARFHEAAMPALRAAVDELTADSVFWTQPARYALMGGMTVSVDEADGEALMSIEVDGDIDQFELEPEHVRVVQAAVATQGAFSVATLQAGLEGASCEQVRQVLDGLAEAGVLFKSA
jgi:hypothetical protein